jgi:hypothetical protein
VLCSTVLSMTSSRRVSAGAVRRTAKRRFYLFRPVGSAAPSFGEQAGPALRWCGGSGGLYPRVVSRLATSWLRRVVHFRVVFRRVSALERILVWGSGTRVRWTGLGSGVFSQPVRCGRCWSCEHLGGNGVSAPLNPVQLHSLEKAVKLPDSRA